MGFYFDGFTLFLISVAIAVGLLPAVVLVVHTLSDSRNKAALQIPHEMGRAPTRKHQRIIEADVTDPGKGPV